MMKYALIRLNDETYHAVNTMYLKREKNEFFSFHFRGARKKTLCKVLSYNGKYFFINLYLKAITFS